MANTKIQSEQIADSAIVADRIAADAVTTAKIADNVGLGGSPTTTTQSASDNSTKIATTAYVTSAIATVIDSAPDTLNTLNELAAALNDQANFGSTVTTSIAAKLPLAGGTMTGNLAIGKEDPNITLTDSSASRTLAMFVDNNNSVVRASGPLLLQVGSQSAITIDASRNATFAGDLGVGDTPSNKLHVKKAGFTRATVESTGNNQSGFQVKRSGSDNDTDWEIYSPSNSTDLRFYNGGDRLLIDTSGNLNVKGRLKVTDGNPQWPTGTLGDAAGRHVMSHNGESLLLIWDESTGAQDNEGALFLGGKPVGSSNYFSGAALYGLVENGSNAAGKFVVKTTNSTGGVATRLTIDSTDIATFSGTVVGSAITIANSGVANLKAAPLGSTYGTGFNILSVTGTSSSPYTSTINFSNYGETDVMTIQGDNVGINDTAPDRKLSIIGSNDSSNGQYPLSLDALNSDYTMEFRRNGTSEWWIAQAGSGFRIHENGVSDQFRVNSGGGVRVLSQSQSESKFQLSLETTINANPSVVNQGFTTGVGHIATIQAEQRAGAQYGALNFFVANNAAPTQKASLSYNGGLSLSSASYQDTPRPNHKVIEVTSAASTSNAWSANAGSNGGYDVSNNNAGTREGYGQMQAAGYYNHHVAEWDLRGGFSANTWYVFTTKNQMDAVDNDWMQENNPIMPKLAPQRKSSVSFGSGRKGG